MTLPRLHFPPIVVFASASAQPLLPYPAAILPGFQHEALGSCIRTDAFVRTGSNRTVLVEDFANAEQLLVPSIPLVAAADVNWASDDVGVSTDTTKATR